MFYLETASAPIITIEPQPFTNADGNEVALSDFERPAADRLALGIWPLESAPYPDLEQVVVTGATYEKLESFRRRKWVTRPFNSQELGGRAAAALEKAKDEKCAAVDGRVSALFGQGLALIGDQYQGKTVQLDQVSQNRITAAGASAKLALLQAQISGAASTFAIEWIMQDNSKVALDAAGMSGMADQCMAAVDKWVKNARAHKDAILALAIVNDVNNYDFSSGW
ncbi:MAG: DUF4376 domain-containing protein [Rhodospirillaceae bacterium]|nr:MAG: DUF4376 domain-containing protein [Rhodospirillaceae bacterium]